MCNVPFYHCFGLVICNLCAFNYGSTIVVPSLTFNPKKSLEAIEKFGTTAFFGVPTMYISVMDTLK